MNVREETMSYPARKLEERYSYADYLSWPEGERWELIHGAPYDMSPAPAPQHQRISREISAQFHRFFSGKSCEVLYAPIDVRLPGSAEQDDEKIETVVQPDILVICDPQKIDERGCKGPPDLIVEILSPSTASKDMREKFDLYEAHGVREYWLVHPFEQLVEVFELGEDGRYARAKKFFDSEKMPVTLFPGLELDLAQVFESKSPPEISRHPHQRKEQ